MNVFHALIGQPFGQFPRDEARAIITQQAWFVAHSCLIITYIASWAIIRALTSLLS